MRLEHSGPRKWLMEHVSNLGDDCLIWPFQKKPNGRGRVGIGARKRIEAHRLMCELAHGPAPFEHAQAAHTCGNGHLGCINSRHLEWKTPRENALDRWSHGTMPSCEKAPAAKISQQIADEMRALRVVGWGLSGLGRKFGLSKSATFAVVQHRTWDDEAKLAALDGAVRAQARAA